jgi:hypothetical protein
MVISCRQDNEMREENQFARIERMHSTCMVLQCEAESALLGLPELMVT